MAWIQPGTHVLWCTFDSRENLTDVRKHLAFLFVWWPGSRHHLTMVVREAAWLLLGLAELCLPFRCSPASHALWGAQKGPAEL
jgi:hypothetical protein